MAKPIIYIKMKPYLKEFILALEGREGEKLYGPEPVQFPKKDKLHLLVDRMRRKPGPGCIPAKPANRKDRDNYLEVTFEPDSLVKHDELRTYLSPDAQATIAKCIYNMFCVIAYEYVNEHLSYQKRCFPRERALRNKAYREFCNDYNLTYAEEDSIRRAFDRQEKLFAIDSVKKSSTRKKIIAAFPQKIGCLARKRAQLKRKTADYISLTR